VEIKTYRKRNSPSAIMMIVQAIKIRKGNSIDKSLAHTKWMCKYHIVFSPKYRRQVIYKQIKTDITKIIKELCKYFLPHFSKVQGGLHTADACSH
jgi:putative transposase